MFKHKIQIHRQSENLTRFPNIDDDAILYISYRSELIDNPEEKGIKNYGDITNGIEPYLYYLASKYQNFTEWNRNYIRFSVYVYRDEVSVPLYDNQYKITSLASDRHMKIDENNTRASNQNLPVEGPFTIFIDVLFIFIL